MKIMKVAYLSVPYSSDNEQVREYRFRAVNKAVAKLFLENKFVFSPISHSHPIAEQEKMPTDFKFWGQYNYVMIRKCDELYVLMLDGWKESIGVQQEIQIAETLGKPIQYIAENYIK